MHTSTDGRGPSSAGGQLLLLLVDGTRPPETHLAPPQTSNPRTPPASPLTPLAGRLPGCSQGQAEPGPEHCSWGAGLPSCPCCCCCPCFLLCFPGWCYTAPAQPAPACCCCLTTTLVQEEHPGGVHLHPPSYATDQTWSSWVNCYRERVR